MLIDYSQQQYWLSVMFSDLVIALLIKAIVITGAPHKVRDPWYYWIQKQCTRIATSSIIITVLFCDQNYIFI